MGIEIAKTNMYVSVGPPDGAILIAKTNMYVTDNGEPEAPTVQGRVNKAAVQVPAVGPVTIEATSLSSQIAAEALPDMEATSLALMLPVDQEKTFQANKVAVQVVCAGRPELAYVRAWTFTLDGHDFYVLQLQDITLVHDIASKQWYNWGSVDREIWRGQIGIDWNANLGKINGGTLGSTSVIVGDWADGSLYFLNTALNEDVGPEGDGYLPFQRLVYGQVPLRGHDYVDCYGVELTGSLGETSGVFNETVVLSYSDDVGHTYVNAGAVTVQPGQYSFVLQWPSLGSFKGPGRIFKIEDWGVLARIDSIDMNDGAG